MRFALINTNRVEAEPGLNGVCPGCNHPVIAKCGTERIHHWAHQHNKACDSWWESETSWHRAWKDNYPLAWQEYFLLDQKTGEKHIADVRTSDELVIEFQHSYIKPQERMARESFYQNMVWVVDGRRLKRDYARFLKGKKDFRNTDKPGIFIAEFPDECFPSTWLKSLVPVIFDFKGIELEEDLKGKPDHLYCLFPNRDIFNARVAEIPRKAFIKSTITGEWLPKIHRFMAENERKRQEQITGQKRRLDHLIAETFFRTKKYRRRW